MERSTVLTRRNILRLGGIVALNEAIGCPNSVGVAASNKMKSIAPAVSKYFGDGGRKLFFLPGYKMTPDETWTKAIHPVLKDHGINAFMPNLPESAFLNRRKYLDAVDQLLVESGGKVDVAGFSLGGGAIQMYLGQKDSFYERNRDQIQRLTLICARNLYNLKISEVPQVHRDFYEKLEDPGELLKRVQEVRVVYAEKDETIFPKEAVGLGIALGVNPRCIVSVGNLPKGQLEHMSIVQSPIKLAEVLS